MGDKMNERQFTAEIINSLKSVGCWVFNVHGHRFQKSGVPDIYVAHPKWRGWIELKVETGKVSPLQIMNIKDLLVRGVPAFVVRWIDGVVYCQLGKETLAWCEDWRREKGTARGISLLTMFDTAGKEAIRIMIK